MNKTLLLLSKIENGQFSETSQIEVNRLVKQYLTDYKEVYAYRHIEVQVEEEGTFFITMNEMLAVVLFTNLFGIGGQKQNWTVVIYLNVFIRERRKKGLPVWDLHLPILFVKCKVYIYIIIIGKGSIVLR